MKYSQEIKQEALSRYKIGRESAEVIFRDLCIPRSTFYDWLRKDAAQARSNAGIEFTPSNFQRLVTKTQHLEQMVALLKSVNCTNASPLSERLAEAERFSQKYSVHLLCDALDISRGTFYNHVLRNKRGNTWYAERRERLRKLIQEIYDDSLQRFGSGKITAVLCSQGEKVTTTMVRELMQEMGLISIRNGAKSLYEKEEKRPRNLVRQNFTAKAPNTVWVSDVTYFR